MLYPGVWEMGVVYLHIFWFEERLGEKNIQTKAIRETPFVVSVVKDGKLSLGDFYSILFKGYNLDQDSWLLLSDK